MVRKLTSGRRFFAALMSGGLLVGALAVLAAGPAQGVATPVPGGVRAYATGTELHLSALQVAAEGPRVGDIHQAHSSAAFNSSGLPSGGQASEISATIVPVDGAFADSHKPAGTEAYGRGAGVDVGLGNPVPNNDNAALLALAGIAGAASHPASGSSDPVIPPAAPTQTGLIEESISVPGDPLVFAGLLRGRAVANWNPNHAMPMLGTPIAYGEGYASDVNVLNLGTANPDGTFTAPVISTDANVAGSNRQDANSKSYTYLVNNGDGTCGVATEIRQTIAPVRLNLPPDDIAANDLIIEVAGEWIMRGVATGKAPATVSYAVGDADVTQPLLRLITGPLPEDITNLLGFEDLFGEEGLAPLDGTPLETVLSLVVGEPPRAPVAPGAPPVYNTPANNAPPTKTTNQLRVAADAVRLRLLDTAVGTPEAGLRALDLRLGHFEMGIDVPTGGINCEIPIDKAGPPSVDINSDATYTVKVPIDAATLSPFPCQLTSITVRDFISLPPGGADTPSKPPYMDIVSGTGPNNIAGVVTQGNPNANPPTYDSITFNGIPNYTPGQPPLTFTIKTNVPSTSGQGKLNNTATATATPGNCNLTDSLFAQLLGSTAFGEFLGSGGAGLTGRITGASSNNITGTDVVGGIGITAGRVLAVTGRNDTLFVGLALAALVAAAGAFRLRRRAVTTD